MFKLLKYELRGRLVFLGGSCIILALINILLLLDSNIFKIIEYNNGLNAVFSMMAGFAAMVVVLVSAITRLERDLYGESGYLTFTLPKSGYKVLGAKLSASFIEIVVFSIINSIFFILQILPHANITSHDISQFFREIAEHFPLITLVLFIMILSLITFILMVYFSLVSVRSFSKSRKLGKAASFCVFIGIGIIIGFITHFLDKTFPQTMSFNLINDFSSHISGPGIQINGSSNMSFNIASSIFSLLLPVGLFISTAYLMEKRVDI